MQEMDIRTFFVSTKNLTEKSTDSVEAGAAAQESVDSVEGATAHSVLLSSSTLSGTFPSDLPVPVRIFWLKVPPSPVIVRFLGVNLAMVICHSTLPGNEPESLEYCKVTPPHDSSVT